MSPIMLGMSADLEVKQWYVCDLLPLVSVDKPFLVT
jgi:hypothetical protein